MRCLLRATGASLGAGRVVGPRLSRSVPSVSSGRADGIGAGERCPGRRAEPPRPTGVAGACPALVPLRMNPLRQGHRGRVDAALLLEELDLQRGRVQLVADEGGAGERTPVEEQETLRPRIEALDVALHVESQPDEFRPRGDVVRPWLGDGDRCELPGWTLCRRQVALRGQASRASAGRISDRRRYASDVTSSSSVPSSTKRRSSAARSRSERK